MSNINKIQAIVSFVAKHPQSTASRRICRELLGEGLERSSEEFSAELLESLAKTEPSTIDSYFYLIR